MTRQKNVVSDLDGPLILVGDEVSYKPTSSNDESGLHQFDKKMFPGIFMGYVLRAGGGG